MHTINAIYMIKGSNACQNYNIITGFKAGQCMHKGYILILFVCVCVCACLYIEQY